MEIVLETQTVLENTQLKCFRINIKKASCYEKIITKEENFKLDSECDRRRMQDCSIGY